MNKDSIIQVLDGKNFLERKLPKREFIVDPCIPKQGLVMIYATRGVGKTYFALLLSKHMVIGKSLDRWRINQSRKVLYIDGEMPANLMQERIKSLNIPLECQDRLSIITRDVQGDGNIPNIANYEDQERLNEIINEKGCDVVIVDNLSTLVRGVRENEADSWTPVQDWILSLRAKGKTVILIHHANKSEKQRGTSRREDVLDTVIKLKHPKDYKSEEGARFQVHFEKSRGFAGIDAEPFEIKLVVQDGLASWHISNIKDLDLDGVVELSSQGLTQREIAKRTGLSVSKVNRLLNKSRYI